MAYTPPQHPNTSEGPNPSSAYSRPDLPRTEQKASAAAKYVPPALPKLQPKDDRELPSGRKDWTRPPQQYGGSIEGPETSGHPTPAESGAGASNWDKPYQQVQAPKSDREIDEPIPPAEDLVMERRPQQIEGPEGPEPTDGTELTAGATSHNITPGDRAKGIAPTATAAKRPAKTAPAKTAGSPSTSSKEGSK